MNYNELNYCEIEKIKIKKKIKIPLFIAPHDRVHHCMMTT